MYRFPIFATVASAVLAIACALTAGASSADVDIACVSVIGDKLTTIEREATSGSSVMRCRGAGERGAGPRRDELAVCAAISAIASKKPNATVAIVEGSGPGTEPLFDTPHASSNDGVQSALYGQLAAGVAKQVDAKRSSNSATGRSRPS